VLLTLSNNTVAAVRQVGDVQGSFTRGFVISELKQWLFTVTEDKVIEEAEPVGVSEKCLRHSRDIASPDYYAPAARLTAPTTGYAERRKELGRIGNGERQQICVWQVYRV
jgi:hypothetical protein